ncbi:Frizzled-6 [Oryzias melastigma]|uniref:Frizzled-6 n=1 Tax=Oryzias melastigma TaxID=30732 RepID=A0A834CJZ8_ORYME|nr:Frizzled-6 [Oryzias melastigma]
MLGPLWVVLALIWVRSCQAHSFFTCEPIKVHRCMGMPYNMTFFPNMMEHYDQEIAASKMEALIIYIV